MDNAKVVAVREWCVAQAYLDPSVTSDAPDAKMMDTDRVRFDELAGLISSYGDRINALDPAIIIQIVLSMVTLIFGDTDSPLARFLRQMAEVLLPLFVN